MSLLTFRFRHSRSDDLPWCLELAKRGAFREQVLSPKQTVYETDFDLLDPLQVKHALSLATTLVHDKKAEVSTGFSLLTMVTVREVLRCYQQSLQADDPQVHCWFRSRYSNHVHPIFFTVSVGSDDRTDLWFPCRLAGPKSGGIHPDQCGTIHEQIHAALVRAGTAWCPRLADLTELKLVNVELQRRP